MVFCPFGASKPIGVNDLHACRQGFILCQKRRIKPTKSLECPS
ncbi:hypothetical protein HHE02_06080 [Helicobacter heilmannii]|nr:hypothetical protein HHE014_06740 [Helicobacter heilmannii]CRF47320.1 hypothetical protein HHE02_06080 [Helicobacter heilmannii]CRF51614.1 hypothetical protein HHE06_15020 [Helicobacter heilmannii]